MIWFRRSSPVINVVVSVEKLASRGRQRRPRTTRIRLLVPTDLVFSAWRQLFPAERMVVFGGRQTTAGVRITSVADVTGSRALGHVHACPLKLTTTLVDLERAAAHVAIWMHSHPGEGRSASHPSATDRRQDRDWRQDYSTHLVGIIATCDGVLRLFGTAIEQEDVVVRWVGQGIQAIEGDKNAYQLQLR